MRVSLPASAAVAICIISALVCIAADEPAVKSPREEFDALVKAQRDAAAEFSRAYQAAPTKEEKTRY
jgi:hypothetical protein